MRKPNRDVLIALVLLVVCGVFLVKSLDIRDTPYASVQPWVWPQIILVLLTLCVLVLMWQALMREPPSRPAEESRRPAGLVGWLLHYRNPLICYLLFFLFLASMPLLGTLISGTLFVFLTLSVLGPPRVSLLPIHLAIAVVSVGAMWAVFTFALKVFLPEGEILQFS